jgi:hypothetical protein
MDDHPIERFDPLLRNLLGWGLVEEGGDGKWVLKTEASERLGSLARLARRPETSAVVYFGHFCAQCHASKPTRLLEGRFLCDACRRAAVEDPAPAEPAEREQRRMGVRHRSRRLAS